MNKTRSTRRGVLLVVMSAAGCGSEDVTCLDWDGQPSSLCEARGAESADGEPSVPLGEQLQQIERDLGIGSRGADVRALHEYLTQFGYLPNGELGETYPRWTPIVAESPAHPEIYDEVTMDAVTWLQRNSGLEVTGHVDEPTRALMRTARCGVPDGSRVVDPSEKYALNQRETRDPLTWRVMDVNGVSDAELNVCADTACKINVVTEDVRIAFSAWNSAARSPTFAHKASGAVDIEIRFVDLDAPAVGSAPYPDGTYPQVLKLDNQTVWSHAAVMPSGSQDLTTIALHEIGHLIGLQHSSVNGPSTEPGADTNGATMRFSASGLRDQTLHVDDKVAASVLYESWQPWLKQARDLAVGVDGSDDGAALDVWVVGDTALGNGFTIHKWDSPFATWSAHATGNQNAKRIAIGPTGRPWIINGSGQVLERSNTVSTTGTWALRGTSSNCATDIGVGGDGTAWILGCSANAAGDFNIYRWTGSGWELPNPGSRGKRISVDGRGVAWLVQADGDIYRRPLESLVWEKLPGTAVDIGAGPASGSGIAGVVTRYSYVYVTAPDNTIWSWDEQVADARDNRNDPGTEARRGWVRTADGLGHTIAVGPDGVPWLLGNDSQVWRQF